MLRRVLSTLALLAAMTAATGALQAATNLDAPPPKKPAAGAPAASKASTKQPAKATAKPAAVAVQPTGPLFRIAVEGSYAPFSEIGKDGKLRGFDVDIANAICAEIKRRCQLVRREWPHIQDGVIGKYPALWGEVDAIVSSVSITESRRQTADFTRSYYHIPARFIARKGEAIDFTGNALSGKRIGVQVATTHDNFVTMRFGKSAEIVRFDTLPAAAKALADGKVDLVMADSLALELGTLKAAKGDRFHFVGPSYIDRDWFGDGAGIVVAKGRGELLQQLDAALDTIKSNGTYGRIAQSYFGFDVGMR